MIKRHGVDMFYVGNHGRFDAIVRSILQELDANYAVVLAYVPVKKSEYGDYSDTMLPDGIEFVHPRFAITYRNRWMIENSDFAITYITHDWGGAALFAEYAKRRGKTVINIASSVK